MLMFNCVYFRLWYLFVCVYAKGLCLRACKEITDWQTEIPAE